MENIIHTGNYPEIFTEESCFIIELLNSPAFPEISIARARVTTGVTTQLHALKDTTEFYYILAGRGECEVNGISKGLVSAGDIVVIPPGAPQRIKNIGDDDLIFLCICMPKFEERNYHGNLRIMEDSA